MALFFDKVNFSRIPPLKGKASDRPSGGEEDKCPCRRARALFKKIGRFVISSPPQAAEIFRETAPKVHFRARGTRENLHIPSVTGLLAK
jgi:hypothetical protein